MSEFEVSFLQAEADGIAPALLLKVGGAKGAQYLINIPEGFSRLVLEHHVRPGANLRAIFSMQAYPEGLGGLAGLLMRLRQDGHGEVHLIGPPGTKDAIHGLRHFVTWPHPRVNFSQTQPGLNPYIYQDGHIKVAALWGAPLCWTPPEWLQPTESTLEPHAASRECHKSPLTGTCKASLGEQEGSESSPEGSSDGGDACEPGSGMAAKASGFSDAEASGQNETSSSEASSADAAGSKDTKAIQEQLSPETVEQPRSRPAQEQSSSSEASSEEDDDSEEAGGEAPSVPAQSSFEELDRVFSSSGARTRALQVLAAKQPGCFRNPLVGMPEKRRKRSATEDVASSAERGTANSCVPGPREGEFATDGNNSEVEHFSVHWAPARGTERRGWSQLPGSANPVFVRSKLCSTVPTCDRLWGLLFRIAPTGQLLLVVHCANPATLPHLLRHPVLQQPGLARLALVVHTTPKYVADSVAYKGWVAQLPGKQVMMHGNPKELGYLASARTLARLNTASGTLFPTPPALTNTGQNPGSQDCGRITTARLLMRAVGNGNNLTFDCEGCPPHPDVATMQQELLEKRPELASLAASLASSTLATQLTSYTSPQPPPFPEIPAEHKLRVNFVAGQLQGQSPSGCSTPGWQAGNGSHSLLAQQGQMPGQGSRQPPGVMAAGQFAQVLQFGRPVGIVQLTPQGWVSPQGLPPVIPAGATPLPPGQPPIFHLPIAAEPQKAQGLAYRPPADSIASPEEHIQAQKGHRWDAEDIELPESSSAEDRAAAEEASPSGGLDSEPVPQCLLDAVARADPTCITFLGTGSAEPSKYRGSSAIHVQLECGYGVLLDAGEGTWGQMVRCYGRKGAAKQVAQLAAVWISHKHADHMLGLPAILHARSLAATPLLVVGPMAAAKWLGEICKTLRPQYPLYRFLACKDCSWDHPEHQWLLHVLGLTEWTAVPVDHCHDAWALVLEHCRGWSLTYSGDSRPCQRLIKAARGSTLLIHEATFEPSLVEQAIQKRHSTSEEALSVAADCGAYRTILTHFSQRYPKLPPSLAGSAETPNPIGSAGSATVAFDGMRVPLCSLQGLPRVMPVLQHALETDDLENPQKNELERREDQTQDPDTIKAAGGADRLEVRESLLESLEGIAAEGAEISQNGGALMSNPGVIELQEGLGREGPKVRELNRLGKGRQADGQESLAFSRGQDVSGRKHLAEIARRGLPANASPAGGGEGEVTLSLDQPIATLGEEAASQRNAQNFAFSGVAVRAEQAQQRRHIRFED